MTLAIASKDYIIDWTKMLSFSLHTKTCQLYRTHVENIWFSPQLITYQCFGMHVLVSSPETQDILCHQVVHSSLLGESRACDPSLRPRPLSVLMLFAKVCCTTSSVQLIWKWLWWLNNTSTLEAVCQPWRTAEGFPAASGFLWNRGSFKNIGVQL